MPGLDRRTKRAEFPGHAVGCPDRSISGRCWPLAEQHIHFELGDILNGAIADALEPATPGSLSLHHAGLWECDLQDGRLIWSGGVYDLFGLQRGKPVTRDHALSIYSDKSRQALERVRADAISKKLGFTIDVEIRPEGVREHRWMRVIAAPVIQAGSVKRLHGIKLPI